MPTLDDVPETMEVENPVDGFLRIFFMLERLWSKVESGDAPSLLVLRGDILIALYCNVIVIVDRLTGVVKRNIVWDNARLTAASICQLSSRIAVGDSRGIVVIRKRNGDGMLKFKLACPIRYLTFSSNTGELAVASHEEIGLWAENQKSVRRILSGSGYLVCEWTICGKALVVCQSDGNIAKYDRTGRTIWSTSMAGAIVFTSLSVSTRNVISVAHYDICEEGRGSISVLNHETGQLLYPSFEISTHIPTKICFYSPDLLLVGMSSGDLLLVSVLGGDFIRLTNIQGWVRSVAVHSETQSVALCSSLGAFECHSLRSFHLTATDKNTSVQRNPDNLNEVEVLDILNLKEYRTIRVDRMFTKLAVCNEMIAILCNSAIQVFSISTCNKLFEFTFPNAHLVSTILLSKRHLVACSDRNRIQFIPLDGTIEWYSEFDSPVRSIKMAASSIDAETFLVGTCDGSVYSLSPSVGRSLLFKHSAGIQTVDVNLDFTYITLVDDLSVMTVYSTPSHKVVYKYRDLLSAVFDLGSTDILLVHSRGCEMTLINLRRGATRSLHGICTPLLLHGDTLLTVSEKNIAQVRLSEFYSASEASGYRNAVIETTVNDM